MDQSPNLSLPYLAAAQSQKHVTHNEALRALDALVQLAVIDQHLITPPAAPVDGSRYIVATGGSGLWAGFDHQVAAFQDGAWMFYAPQLGWRAWVESDAGLFVWTGTAWVPAGGLASVNPIALVGVNATADTTNRLSVKSPAVLFDNIGNGVQAKLNKATPADTASVLFQDGYSGRAEIGLTGDDNAHIKVSADGTTWHDALVIQGSTGQVTFPNTASTAAPQILDQTGRYLLRNWQAKLALIQQNSGSARAVIAYIGDSWVYNDFITNPLKRVLQARYGNAGPGYATLSTIGGNASEVTVTTAGTWTENGGQGVDLNSPSSTDVATPASKTLTCIGTDFIIHYYQQPGGGSFTYSVDGGAAITVNTAAAALTYATIGINGLALASHAIAMRVTGAGTAGVKLCGVDVQIAAEGVRLHRIGATGQQVSGYLNAVSEANWGLALQALNPDAVVIQFATNEMNVNTTPATFTATLGTLISWVRAALPNVDVILSIPSDNGITGKTYAISDYATAMAAAAAANTTGFLNNYLNIGPYAHANAMGLYQDIAHLNQFGGQMLANIALAYFCDGVQPNTISTSGTRNVFVGLNPGDPSFIGSGVQGAGGANTTGTDNFGGGYGALAANTTGSSNLAFGSLALKANTTGSNNVALGANALQVGIAASNNVAIGTAALQHNTANNNTAIGLSALLSNTTGSNNVALGVNALATNSSGSGNLAIGSTALSSVTTGSANIGVGSNAITQATTGSNMVGIGQNALYDLTTGTGNIGIGYSAGRGITTGNNNTVIGAITAANAAVAGTVNNTILIGDGAGNVGLQITSARVPYTYAASYFLGNKVTLAGGPTTATPTLTAGPVAGNPTKWLPYDDNGTTRYVPAW